MAQPYLRATPDQIEDIKKAVAMRQKLRNAQKEKAAGSASKAPQTDDELWDYVKHTWGVEIPRYVHPECLTKGHSPPFTAFADAYFARHPNILIPGSRGLSGKTFLAALLSVTEEATLGADVDLLGGSLEQGLKGHQYTVAYWDKPNAPKHLLMSDPTARSTKLTNGGMETVRSASSKSTRGGHPQRLRIDEIDEMELAVLDGALGMPMSSPEKNINSQVFMTSTHHKANGPMTEMKRRFRDGEIQGRVHTWCWRESLVRVLSDEECQQYKIPKGTRTGWATPEMIEEAKGRVSKLMWVTEFELAEPSIEGRAIDTASVDEAFRQDLGTYEGIMFEQIDIPCCQNAVLRDSDGNPILDDLDRIQVDRKIFPHKNHLYVTGVDWGRRRDKTVYATYRTDTPKWHLVSWLRAKGPLDWPQLVKLADDRLTKFPGKLAHDASGMGGDMAQGYLTVTSTPIVLVGKVRDLVFNDYISAIESGLFVHPRIKSMYDAHRYVTLDDLYGSGHPPDEFIASAVAWYLHHSSIGALEVGGSVGKGIMSGLN